MGKRKTSKDIAADFLGKYFKQVEDMVADAVAKILKEETVKLLQLIKERAVPGPPGKTLIPGKDFEIPPGKDADPAQVAKELVSLLPETEARETAEELALKLNTLEEKIKQRAIEGLEEEFLAIRGLISNLQNLGGGGGDTIAIRNLTSQTDGSTKSFTLTRVREVIGVWGTQFPITHDPDADWDYAESTGIFTLSDEVGAPKTGHTLWLLVKES